ncbi:phage tail terminator protein [Magnetofaba australis]|uniref:phage tail terminator protein n=1 Tax=Magnetofaba australis TaxID=1472297 RepID=UPI000A19EE12|nr:hypothetical protein [Magnetofaba australis]
MDDYLSAEPLIVARLKEQIRDARIHSSWGVPAIRENHDLPPSVIVFLEEDAPGAVADTGSSQKVEQTWLCLVVVRDAETESGTLVSQVIRAMAGWKPAGSPFSAFKRVKSAYAPDYSPNGVFYFPLAFATSFVFSASK